MRRAFQLMSGFILAGLATLSTADVPVAWNELYQGRNFSKLARDASGYIYSVTKEHYTKGAVLYVDKFAPNGSKVWQKGFVLSSSLVDVDLRSATTDNAYLYVVLNERNMSSGAVTTSRLMAYSQSSGTVSMNKSVTDGSIYSCAVGNNTQVALLLKDSAGIGKVEFINRSNWGAAGTAVLGNVAATTEVRMDATGNAYAGANNTNGSIQISRSSAAGGLAFQTNFSSPPRTNGNLARVEFDSVNNRVYGLSNFDWSPTDKDAVLVNLDSNTGAMGSTTIVGGTTDDELVGDLVPTTGGVLLSLMIPATHTSVTMKRTTTGLATWNRILPTTLDNYNRPIGFDVDGNVLVVSSHYATGNFQLDRLKASDGTLLDRSTYHPGNFNNYPTDARFDSAGNVYIMTNMSQGCNLLRLQRAELTVSSNNVPGGTPTTGNIKSTLLPSSQEWALSSSNPSVVGVPGSVTISANQSIADFPITTAPVASITNVSINARLNGFVCQMTVTVLPSVVQSVAVSPQVVKGGVPSTGTVTLKGNAIAGGLNVLLASNKSLVASVPASVVVPAQSNQATFPITTYGVNSNQGVVITATTGAVSKTAFFAVNAPSLVSITTSPGTLTGGTMGSMTITLDGIAPTGGFSVVLFSGAPGIVTLPASAIVNADQTTRTINVPTTSVSSSINVTLIATRSGIYKTTTLLVNP